jgi:hydrogenase maturation protein HypF
LFDCAAALLGFTRGISFEGQAAMWLEQLARGAGNHDAYPFPFIGSELDFRPLLAALIADRLRGRNIAETARAFQRGVAVGLANSLGELLAPRAAPVVLSGGVFQNELFLEDLKALLLAQGRQVWTNQAVPPNDGGISLGQAALAVHM